VADVLTAGRAPPLGYGVTLRADRYANGRSPRFDRI
jgi:hypothetical protein